MRALLSVANRDGIAALARDLLALEVEVFATDGTREYLAADGIEVASVSELTQAPSTRRRPGQDVPSARSTPGILARRDIPAQLDELVEQGIGLIDLVVVNVKPFAPEVGAKLVGIDEAIEMIDVGGAALLGAAARNAAGVAAVSRARRTTPAIISELRELGQRQPGDCAPGLPPTRSARSPPTTPRSPRTSTRSRATLFPSRLAMVLEKVDDLRYGENPHQRAAFYRETTHRSGTLADATQLQGDRAVVQQPARPRRRLPDRARLHRADGRHRQAHRPGRARVAATSWSRPTATRSRPTPSRRSAGSSASTASSTGRRPARSPRTRTRRSSRPGYSQAALGILAARPASSCSPSRPTRPRACATTASPASTSSASPAGCWSRPSTSSGSIAASSRS